MGIVENLLNQNVSKKLIDEALYFKQYYKLDKNLNHRISNTNNCFYGKEIWEMSIASILEGEPRPMKALTSECLIPQLAGWELE